MRYIVILLFCFSSAHGQGTSTGTIQGSYEFTTQWVKNVQLQVKDIALCYDFFAARPGVLQAIKQKIKAIGLNQVTDSTVITFDSVRIEVVVELGNFIRSRIPYPDYFNRIDGVVKNNAELRQYYIDKDDRDIRTAITNAKSQLTQ